MLKTQTKSEYGWRHPKQKSWSQFKCNLSDICRKDHSERKHRGTAGSQAQGPDWKAERRPRGGRPKQTKEFVSCGLKKGLRDFKGSRAWRSSRLQKLQTHQWGEEQRHTKTCPPAPPAWFWTTLPKLPTPQSLPSQASLLSCPLLNTCLGLHAFPLELTGNVADYVEFVSLLYT